jgi:dUTP pyrophosphatase
MTVDLLKLHDDAVVPFKSYEDDFCYDVVATSEEQVAPNVWKYGIGLAMEIVRSNSESMGHRVVEIREGFNEEEEVWETLAKTKYYQYDFCNSPIKLSIDLRPRSSVWKTGMVLSNCVGTIDESYRGEISAVFYHLMPDMPRYKVGDKIAQAKLGFTMPMDFNIVKKLSDSKRGAKGYGSTGK